MTPSLEEIERELNERLSKLGLPALIPTTPPAARATTPLRTGGGGMTQILNLSELRTALRQQVRIAEIKDQIAAIILEWHREKFRTGEIKIADFEVRAADILLPYCREFIPNFPAAMRPVELAVDLNLETILRTTLPRGLDRPLTPDEIDRCTVQVIQALLKHPLIPQTAADHAEVSLQTTVLKDKNGTAVYSPSDAAYLKRLIEEQKLLDREGEVGLLAMLISARKWQKITDDALFAAAVEYTLEALAKRRGIPSITLRNQGPDHPVAYILSEYVQHHLSESLEAQIKFIETALAATVQMLKEEGARFVDAVRYVYVPLLRQVFFDLFPDVLHRFLHGFEREFLSSSRTLRSKLFLLKRVGDFCELAFYCHDAMRKFTTPTGDIYAVERLTEGTAHFARRNGLPLAEGMDVFNQRNTLAELLVNAIKHRRSIPLSVGDTEELRRQAESVATSDLLNCLNHLRRVFDHDYARARENSYEHYLYWRSLVLEWSRTYVRLLTGRTPNDVEQYHLDGIAAWHIEQELAFTKIHFPSFVQSDRNAELVGAATMRQPHEILQEAFLRFWRAFHISILTRAQEQAEYEERVFSPEKHERHAARVSVDDLGKRAFLARSDLPMATYTFERLAQHVTPQTHDATVVTQSIEVALELAGQAYVYEEIVAARACLRRIQRRLDDLLVLNETERLEYRARIPAMLRDLDRREPIQLASYIVALGELETLDLTDERVLVEWQTLETTIQRLTQISSVLIMARSRTALRALARAFDEWYATLPEDIDPAERRTYAQRRQDLQELAKMSWLTWWLRRWFLRLIWTVQCVASVPDWRPPETYLLEDCLGLDTPPVRLRDLEMVLASYPPTEVARLARQLRETLTERLAPSSGSDYYTKEERTLLEERLQRIERLARRPLWKAAATRWTYTLIRLCLTPFRRATPRADASHPQQSS
ncbi:MAG: hypothetical protein NZ585_06200 [Chloracidobacterium sp.]|nr:hypothetical protein [Chloracidobacterium sp.]MDW8216106.1 hypothetical protein [Acidobacteriota bacterium]